MCYQCAYGGVHGRTCMKTEDVIEECYEFRLCDLYVSQAGLMVSALEKEVEELKAKQASQNHDPAAAADEDALDERVQEEIERVGALLNF